MKITCQHCDSKANISNSVPLHKADKKVYVNCTNFNCNARFVMTVSHSYDVRLPDSDQSTMIEELIAKMEPETRSELLKKYQEPRRLDFMLT